MKNKIILVIQKAFFFVCTISVYTNISAQSMEEYKKWETVQYTEMVNYEEKNSDALAEGNMNLINDYYKKLLAAIEKDPKNPLLLKKAGDVQSFFMNSGISNDEIKFYTVNVEKSGSENKAILEQLNKHFNLLHEYSISAEKYYKQAASMNESQAIIALVQFYRKGYFRFQMTKSIYYPFVFRKMNTELISLLIKARELGNENAALILAEVFIIGEDEIKSDVQKADLYLNATSSPIDAYLMVAMNFLDPQREVRNSGDYYISVNNALRCLIKSAEMGSTDAAFFAAEIYLGKNDINDFQWKDDDKAFFYLKKATVSEEETPEAYYYLANCYLKGQGIDKDIRKGISMIEKLLALNTDNFDKQALQKIITEAKKNL
jgi:hypothetical protein